MPLNEIQNRLNAIQDARFGAEVETNPEGEEVPQPVRRIPLPEPMNEDLYFHSPGGSRVTSGTVRPGNMVQITVWSLNPTRARAAYSDLKRWAVENDVGFGNSSSEYFYEEDYSATIPFSFSLCELSEENARNPVELLSQPDCDCGAELEYPTLVCPNCDRIQYCNICRDFRNGIQWDDEQGTMCSVCGSHCDECGRTYHHTNSHCPNCHPMQRCRGCSTPLYLTDDEHITWENQRNNMTYYYCPSCSNGLCHTCGIVDEVSNIIQDGDTQNCVSCVSMSSNEEWDENSELESEQLSIPAIPGRETIRLVGVEIEGANGDGVTEHQGGNMLAEALYSEGLTRNYQMGGYHSSSRGQLVHVERDSSVDWELVIGPLNAADCSNVDTLNRSVRVLRRMINEKTLKLDMRAGLHIHVGADKVPFHNAYNLHKLYMYMEDFLYRFGAAKWPYHRSINRRGRDQAGKSPNVEGKLHFARTFSGQRYYGLSFDNYFARYFEQCSCGARTYGLFDECTCDLGKCTFEFRLFNTTANTVKLHAYLAICQALVAKAIAMDEIRDLSQYPALDFLKSRVSDMTTSVKRRMGREWEKRIVFVNEELPLTPEEKKSVHYCIVNSELGKIVTNADILLETEDN